MMALRAALLAVAGFGVGTVAAQTPSFPTNSESLPPGLVRSGGVVMMAPIPDTEENGASPVTGGERRLGLAHVLSAADHDLYEHAFDAADRGDWIAARGLADQGHDSIARLLVQWRYLLDRNSGASFGEISEFLKSYPEWPDRDTLYARAEHAIDPRMDAHAVLAWFGDRVPVSAIGKVRLGEALTGTGSSERGAALIREAWTDGSFEPDQEFAIIQNHGDLLTPEIDRVRLEHLLWRNDTQAVRRELARVPADAQRVAEARLMLRTNTTSGERLIADLPDSLKSDPGIVFDRTHLLRQRSNIDEIPGLLVRSPTHEMAKLSPSRWWAELNLATREAIQASSYSSAYAIASHTGLTADDGTEYSEAQFLAGWIALRFLKDPRSALVHFQNLAGAVSRPISLARANYWEARAYEAANDPGSAWQHYKSAADSPDTFYGQLALARIAAEPKLHLKDQVIDASAARADYEHETLTHAIRVLADLGDENLLRLFSVHDVRVYGDPRHVKLLAEDLVRMGFQDVGVRVAKEAGYNGIALLAYSHPVIAVPGYSGPGTPPDTALVLGIIRQETEFDPASVSSAGARGIIQVMPGSARHFAALAGLPYRPNDLTNDPDYDLKLGMTELAGELSDWGGSFVLAVAAYNAGPTNVKRWIATFGDPRDARVDPVDWIEEIPFSETRNYVQRVLENTEVYRNRLSGTDQRLQILADLYRPGAIPQMQPLDYEPVSAAMPSPVPRPASESNDDSITPAKDTPVSAPNPNAAGVIQQTSLTGTPAVAPKPKPEN
jgi:soluble lytic murein transglycosylase